MAIVSSSDRDGRAGLKSFRSTREFPDFPASPPFRCVSAADIACRCKWVMLMPVINSMRKPTRISGTVTTAHRMNEKRFATAP